MLRSHLCSFEALTQATHGKQHQQQVATPQQQLVRVER